MNAVCITPTCANASWLLRVFREPCGVGWRAKFFFWYDSIFITRIFITRGLTGRQPLRNSRTDCTYDAKRGSIARLQQNKKYALLKRILQTCPFISLETTVIAYPFQRHYCISCSERTIRAKDSRNRGLSLTFGPNNIRTVTCQYDDTQVNSTL